MTPKMIDTSMDAEVGQEILNILTDTGYTVEEAIAGLLYAIRFFAIKTENPDQTIDEAVRYLEGD